jgi:hypothetical protein
LWTKLFCIYRDLPVKIFFASDGGNPADLSLSLGLLAYLHLTCLQLHAYAIPPMNQAVPRPLGIHLDLTSYGAPV